MNSYPAYRSHPVAAPFVGVGDTNYPPYPPSVATQAPAAPPIPAVIPTPAPPVAPVPVPLLPLPSATTLQAGHRYQIQQLAPIPGMSPATPAQAQPFFDAIMPGALTVNSIAPASGGQPITMIVDALQSVPIVLPSTMPLTDLGLSPGSAPAPAPTPAPASGTTFTFVAGAMPMPINAAPGTPVLFALPPGGIWQSFSLNVLGQMMPSAQNPQIGTSTPIPISTPPGPATAAATWTDSTGAKQVGAAIFLPPGVSLSTPITDSPTVTATQTLLNSVANASTSLLPPGLTIAPVAVNGSASDPGFVQQLGVLQRWMVNAFANPQTMKSDIAPTSLNIPTNGALDFATLAALSLPL